MDNTTRRLIEELGPAELLALFNRIPGVRQASRFTDRTTAGARVRLALEERSLRLVRPTVYHPEIRILPVGTVPTIRVLVDHNPKRGLSRPRFASYRDGMTVEERLEQLGTEFGMYGPLAHRDIRWDRERDYIAVVHE